MKFFAFILNTADDIMGYDYRGAANRALDTIERIWQIIAAAFLIAADLIGMVWANGGREAAADVVLWWNSKFIPGVENAITTVYSAGVRSRILWQRLNSPLFISL